MGEIITYDTVNQTVELLGEKLGPIGELVWSSVLRQQAIEGMFLILTTFLSWGVILLLLKYGVPDTPKYDKPLLVMLCVMGAMCSMLLFFVGVSHLLNPEWNAIKELLRTAGGY